MAEIISKSGAAKSIAWDYETSQIWECYLSPLSKSLLANVSNLLSHLKSKHCIIYNEVIDAREAYLVGV